MIEEIDKRLDELCSCMSLSLYRLNRLKFEKRLQKRGAGLLRHRVYQALNVMSHDYPDLWIDFKGAHHLVADDTDVSHRHFYRVLNNEVHDGFVERSPYYRSFKSRHPETSRPALKVLPYGLLCTSDWEGGKPYLIIEHFERRKLPRYVYRGKVTYGITNAGLEGLICLLRAPLFLKDVPTNWLVSNLVGEPDANTFNKAILFIVKSGRLERFRKDLMDFGFKALRYFRKNRQTCEKLLKLQLQSQFSIRRRLDTLMVKCGLRRIHRYESEWGVNDERLVVASETLLERFLNFADETNFKPELSHILIQDCCEMLEKIRPKWETHNGAPYLACPMCGYQTALEKDKARVLYESFHCKMCGYKPPEEVKIYYCEKCGGPVPITDFIVSKGRTRCFRCFQTYPPRMHARNMA